MNPDTFFFFFFLFFYPFLSRALVHTEKQNPGSFDQLEKKLSLTFNLFFFFFSLGAKEVAQPKSSGFDSIAIHFLEKTPPLLAFHRPVKTRLPSPTG